VGECRAGEGLGWPAARLTLAAAPQVKTEATDGYSAVQLGYDKTYEAKINKPELGHLAKSGAPPLRKLSEFRVRRRAVDVGRTGAGRPEPRRHALLGPAQCRCAPRPRFLASPSRAPRQVKSVDGYSVGQQVQAESLFKAGDLVDVQGTSIGKGFQGGIKRHGFARGLMSHGSKSHRAPGAIGGNTAGRVFAFQRMPGQMGNETVKVRKLEVVRVTSDSILVKGSVPGKPGNVLRITAAKIVGSGKF